MIKYPIFETNSFSLRSGSFNIPKLKNIPGYKLLYCLYVQFYGTCSKKQQQ